MATETVGALEEAILVEVRKLPPERQQQVLDFVEFLRTREGDPDVGPETLMGMWSHLHLDLSEEAIAQARREMWGNFPRELPD